MQTLCSWEAEEKMRNEEEEKKEKEEQKEEENMRKYVFRQE